MRSDVETGQTIISGMGELHLDILVDRMMREFRVQARVGKPQVAYRESITKPVEKAECRYVKQTGGRGQYGHVVLELEPGEPGSGIVYEEDIVGGVIPKEYLPAVEKGVRESAEAGVIAGFPVVDVKVRLYDGSFHEVDSNEMAFKLAGSMAFKEGIQRGGPILQEPVMKVEVVAPDEFLGEIIGQLECAPRGDLGNGTSSWFNTSDPGNGASGRDVRICNQFTFRYPGSGRFHHGIRPLCSGFRECGKDNYGLMVSRLYRRTIPIDL